MKNIFWLNWYNGGFNFFILIQYVFVELLGKIVCFKVMGNINIIILSKFIYFKSRFML